MRIVLAIVALLTFACAADSHSGLDSSGAVAADIVDTLGEVPGGLTIVPAIELGTSVADATRELDRAGLVADSPEVDYPHYATGTDPTAGTLVAVGTHVTLTIGDG